MYREGARCVNSPLIFMCKYTFIMYRLVIRPLTEHQRITRGVLNGNWLLKGGIWTSILNPRHRPEGLRNEGREERFKIYKGWGTALEYKPKCIYILLN